MLVEVLAPLRLRYEELAADPGEVTAALSKGAATGMTPMPSLEGVGRRAER